MFYDTYTYLFLSNEQQPIPKLAQSPKHETANGRVVARARAGVAVSARPSATLDRGGPLEEPETLPAAYTGASVALLCAPEVGGVL